ncbi:MAG: DNA-binding MarR family transcriptional regulator [Alphaproteobacteria bacterium]|jgi:DNA-binding MarR family transcriptional regulator
MNGIQKDNISNEQKSDFVELRDFYIDMISYVERLHRLMIDVIKTELENNKIEEISAVQALLLCNIGAAELTAGELKTRGYYLGSNVSYNLKKLVELGYVSYEKSHIDRRSVRIKLTPLGEDIAILITELYTRHTQGIIDKHIIDVAGIEEICLIFKDFEHFWNDDIRYK